MGQGGCAIYVIKRVPLADLFGCSTMTVKKGMHLCGDIAPLFAAVLFDQFDDDVVLLACPESAVAHRDFKMYC